MYPSLPQPDTAGASSVPFPRSSELSLVADDYTGSRMEAGRPRLESLRRASALEVHELVYGTGIEKDGDALRGALERLYEADAVYENPLITADGRNLITEIYALSHRLSDIRMPKPWMLPAILFGRRASESEDGVEPWFKMLRVWSEVVEVCESESFDGARTAMLEQVIHILLLPEMHTASGQPAASTDSVAPRESVSTVSLLSNAAHNPLPPPKLTLPLLNELPLPSPFHIQLHMVTKLSFNERGHIAHHRDYWDIRDVAETSIPGASALGWIVRRIASFSLVSVAWLLRMTPHRPATIFPPTRPGSRTVTNPPSPVMFRTSMPMTRTQEDLIGGSQAPDVDRDSMF